LPALSSACTPLEVGTEVSVAANVSQFRALKFASSADLRKLEAKSDLSRALESLGWLAMSSRGGTPLVYVDGHLIGGIEVLQTIAVADVERVELLGAGEATQRFGTSQRKNATGTVFVVTTIGSR
jgi:glutaredoxin-related protein